MKLFLLLSLLFVPSSAQLRLYSDRGQWEASLGTNPTREDVNSQTARSLTDVVDIGALHVASFGFGSGEQSSFEVGANCGSNSSPCIQADLSTKRDILIDFGNNGGAKAAAVGFDYKTSSSDVNQKIRVLGYQGRSLKVVASLSPSSESGFWGMTVFDNDKTIDRIRWIVESEAVTVRLMLDNVGFVPEMCPNNPAKPLAGICGCAKTETNGCPRADPVPSAPAPGAPTAAPCKKIFCQNNK